MTTVLRGGQDLAHAVLGDRRLQCMAAFFDGEVAARAACLQLHQQGVAQGRAVLLGPGQASWMAYARQARAWTPARHAESRSGLSDAPMMATLWALALGLPFLVGVAAAGVFDDGLAQFALVAAPLAGAVLGWSVAMKTDGPTQRRHFDRHVRGQLAAGRWVVLTHQLPLQQQAVTATLLRDQALGWCVVSEPWSAI